MKICQTCSHWSPEKKGTCHRTQQGAGKFWSCGEWVEDPPTADTLAPVAEYAAGRVPIPAQAR